MKFIFRIALLSVLASGSAAAMAESPEKGSDRAISVASTRSSDEVKSEARSIRRGSSYQGVIAAPKSGLSRAEVRSQAVQAARAGTIAHGELGPM